MKLLLTSAGIANPSLVDALQKLVGKPFNETNIAFIPTASNMESGDKWWLLKDLQICTELKFKSIDIVDISALPEEIWQKRLEEADVFIFEGGNTYHLMYWLNKSGLKDLLPELLKTKVWVGISAGTIVATPSLFLSSFEAEPVKKIGETIYDDGLNLVNFLVVPHINNEYFPEMTFDYIENESKNVSQTIYALDDNSAIMVDGQNIEVISEGQWKKFN
jgi:dipeptidase E